MILSSVIIVLGEVLEASVLLSLFLALSFRLGVPYNWVYSSLLAGSAGAIAYAISFDNISQWYEGFGQEVVNASIQLIIYICLLLFNAMIYIMDQRPYLKKHLQYVMALCISLAVTREGAEIYLYIAGFYSSDALITPVITGSILGAGIGLSLGFLIYYIFIKMDSRVSLRIGYSLLLLVAAGMILQAIRMLIQIDWLPAQAVIWDVSDWLDESSVTGRLLYTLVGYEATPTLIEVQCYVASIATILIVTILLQYYVSRKSLEH